LKSHRRKFTRDRSTPSQNCFRPCADDDTGMGSLCLDFHMFFFPVRIQEDLYRRLGWNCIRYGSVRRSASCCIGPIVSQQYSALCDPTSYFSVPYRHILPYSTIFCSFTQHGPTPLIIGFISRLFNLSLLTVFLCFPCKCLKMCNQQRPCRTSLDDRVSLTPHHPLP